MRSLFTRLLALCLIAGLAIVPTTVFAQSSGTFTVYKDFTDDNPASVDVSLSCFGTINVTTSNPQSASEGTPAVFNFTDAELPVDCAATESAPSGYTHSNPSACENVFLNSTGSDTAEGSCSISNTPECGDGIVTFAEDCEASPSNECCDGTTCQFESQGFECAAALGSCDQAEVCTGTAADCPTDGANLTTECNPAGGDCDPAEFCSDADNDCPVDDGPQAGFECRPAAGVCDQAEICDGFSFDCPADEFIAADTHTECRADAGGDGCDVAEVCDGTSVDCPLNGFAAEGTLCGDVPDFQCDAQDICDGSSNTCIPNPDPLAACGVIGKGDGCELNICDSGGPSDFKLLFTPDLPNWVAYKLNASNPGQFFYTLVSEPDVPDDANLLLQIPFPFVTQGNMTLHVFDAAGVTTEDSCLVIDEGAGSTPYPVEITMDSYWGEAGPCAEPSSINPPTEPGAYCKHITGPNPEDFDIVCPSEYDPDDGGTIAPSLALQECWAYVPVELENVGRFAARLHLDYGLKGKHLDTYCPSDETVDRYAPGGKGSYGDFDARGIDVNESSISNYWLNTCNIPTCQPYTFAQGVESDQPSDCYTNHGGLGCDDAVCEDIVCGIDSYCCDTAWDNICAGIADTECSGDPVPVDPAESAVESVNYWKKPLGIFGRAFCDDSNDPLLGEGFVGLEARLFKTYALGPNVGTPLAKSPTDADGYYFLNYKHKGKAVYYHVELWNTVPVIDVLLAETSGTGNPGNVPLQANGFAEQDFFDGGAYTCNTASNAGWAPSEYSITKGKFKTIVTP